MSSVIWEIQRSVYNALTVNDAIQLELGSPARIYDDPPVGAPFPYLTIGETRARDYRGINGAIEHLSLIHISEPTRPY